MIVQYLVFFVCVSSAGENTYNLDTAGGLRMEVQKYYELIDALRLAPFSLHNITMLS